MTTANAMNISRVAVLRAPASTARHVDRVAAMALGLLLYGLVMAYLLVASAGIWTSSRPADAPFAVPAAVVHQASAADNGANQVPSRPQPGFAPR
jgi:hypothetical protein